MQIKNRKYFLFLGSTRIDLAPTYFCLHRKSWFTEF